MKKELSFSEILQKNIDKINKKQQDNLKFMLEFKNKNNTKDDLKPNQINIMDLIK